MENAQSFRSPALTSDKDAQLEKSIESWLIAKLSEWLALDPKEIDPTQPATLYGMNSITAVTMGGELEDWLGLELEPTVLFEYPSVEALTRFLVEQVRAAESAARPDSQA